MTDIITTLQLLLITLYVTFIYRRYGVLTSISASTYHLGKVERSLFYFWLVGLAGLNLAQGMEIWGIITAIGLCFSGVTLDHAEPYGNADKVHLVGTVAAIIAAFSGLFFLYGMWIPTVLLLVGIALLYKNKNFIWWIELVAFGLVLGSYYLR